LKNRHALLQVVEFCISTRHRCKVGLYFNRSDKLRLLLLEQQYTQDAATGPEFNDVTRGRVYETRQQHGIKVETVTFALAGLHKTQASSP